MSGRKNHGAELRGPDHTANGPPSRTARTNEKSSETKRSRAIVQ
jgi:hypothetical protein